MPVLLDCNFVIDSTNGNGLGIRNLKGPYIQNVFMNTSATPGLGNSNPASPNVPVTNPNPAPGTIIVQFMDNFARTYTGGNALVSPLAAGSASIVGDVAYVITALGTTTAAQWLAAGVPIGLIATPAQILAGQPVVAIGLAFIAASTQTIPGAPTVNTTAALGTTIATIETVGDTNQSIAPNSMVSQGYGGQIILQCRNFSDAIAAPANGSVISLSFLLSNSSVLLAGE